MACPNKYALGIPGKGFHETRLGPIALYDTLGTVALAAITSYIWKINIWISILAWFVVGEVLHYWFGTPTAFLRMIDMTPNCQ
jgi:hypothetical protein